MNRETAKDLFRKDRDSYGKPKGVMRKIDQIFNEFEKSKTCKSCKFWEQNTHYENVLNDGFCSELNGSTKITIELKAGWDGAYVNKIETTEDFGCILHMNK